MNPDRADIRDWLACPALQAGKLWKLRLYLESQLRGSTLLVFVPTDGGRFLVGDGLQVTPKSPHMRYLWLATRFPWSIVYPHGVTQRAVNFSRGLSQARKQIAWYSPDLGAELLNVHRVGNRGVQYRPSKENSILTRYCP